jgi:hypothetical protein
MMPLFAQIDGSHLGVGAASAATALALAQTVRYLIKKKENKENCKALQLEAMIERHQVENRQVFKEIRDGVLKLCTLTEQDRSG